MFSAMLINCNARPKHLMTALKFCLQPRSSKDTFNYEHTI